MARLLCMDAHTGLSKLKDRSHQCCVTSPPYWLQRDYGMRGQLGREPDPAEYVDGIATVLQELRRVLTKDGVCWMVLGDTRVSNWPMGAKRDSSWWSTRSGDKEGQTWKELKSKVGANLGRKNSYGVGVKNLLGLPWRIALAAQQMGWVLRGEVIWHKPNAREAFKYDRPIQKHETVLVLANSVKSWWDKSIQIPSVMSVPTVINKHEHTAAFPPELIRPMIQATCPKGGRVIDPFMGSGTVGEVSREERRKFTGIELNKKTFKVAERRLVGAEE